MRAISIIINYELTYFFCKVKEVIKSSLKYFLNYKYITYKEKFIKSSLSFLNSWGKPNKYKVNNGNVLIDCMWNNPNYWFRYVLVRNSLKLYESNQFALFGQYSLNIENLICRTFDFKSLGSLFNRSKPKINDLKVAIKLLREVKNSNDFLNIKLPYSFPASVLYDGILKTFRKV